MTNDSVPQFGERLEPGADNFCYRHEDRLSFTLCQRCGRTICPECQTASAVGVQCVSCVRATVPTPAQRWKRSVRVTARRLGDTDRPIVSYTIMIICGMVFVAQLLGRWLFPDTATGIDPVTGSLWYVAVYSLSETFEPWRLVTVMMTHSTGFWLHIAFNMYALWLFGPNLERMLGRVWFTVLYLFSGVGGSLAVMLWVYVSPQPVAALLTPTVGASGAIFGVLAATLVAYRAQRLNVTSIAVLIGMNLAIGFFPGTSISWQAHLGGALVGALTMWTLTRARSARTQKARVLEVSALAGALAILSCAYLVVPPLTGF